jgi:hypothetical protein
MGSGAAGCARVCLQSAMCWADSSESKGNEALLFLPGRGGPQNQIISATDFWLADVSCPSKRAPTQQCP